MKQDEKTWRLQKGNRVIFIEGRRSRRGTIEQRSGKFPNYFFLIRPDDGSTNVMIAAQFVKHEDPSKRSDGGILA